MRPDDYRLVAIEEAPGFRHRGWPTAVRANPILGGLHHEYFLAPSRA
jgi:hypothetical protein